MSDLTAAPFDPALPVPPDHEHAALVAPTLLAAPAWGPGWPECQGGKQVKVTAGGVSVNCRAELARLVEWALRETANTGYRLKQDQTGAYACRAIGGTNTASNHSWGLAIDLNWRENPFTTDPNAARTITPAVVAVWKAYGFSWGGDWGGKKDFMHFEFNGSPAEAARRVAGLEPPPPPPPPPPDPTLDWAKYPVTLTDYPEAAMRRLTFTLPLDATGCGWRDIGVNPENVVSLVANAADPPSQGYRKVAPGISRLNVAGRTRVVVVCGPSNGVFGLDLWVATG